MPLLLELSWLRSAREAESRRLLRILQLRQYQMSAEAIRERVLHMNRKHPPAVIGTIV
jgi:hypothetical protein